MGVKFAEAMLDGMVDENGKCGERGMSAKQYGVLRPYLKETEPVLAGGWCGDFGHRDFYEWDAEGYVGRYHVKLHCFNHFNLRVAVESIERWIDELPTFESSEWVHEPKKRTDMELTVIRVSGYERPAYTYGYEWVNVYTMADADGNCYVWKSANYLDMYDADDEYVSAAPGDTVSLKATVKEHSEWRGIRQTVITRPKVKAINGTEAA